MVDGRYSSSLFSRYSSFRFWNKNKDVFSQVCAYVNPPFQYLYHGYCLSEGEDKHDVLFRVVGWSRTAKSPSPLPGYEESSSAAFWD